MIITICLAVILGMCVETALECRSNGDGKQAAEFTYYSAAMLIVMVTSVFVFE